MKNPGVGIVFQVRTETFFDNPAAKCRVQHGKGHFDAPEKIAIHPVGAGEKHSVIAIIEEIEDPAVLEKSSNDGAYTNMFRKAGDAWS